MRELNLSSDYLKATTGKFDLESIFILSLTEKSIAKLGDVENCVSLYLLNLSKNQIFSLGSLGALKKLVFLDVSYNKLSSIDGINSLGSLKQLKAQGNQIDDKTKDLCKLFENMVSLEKVYFQELSGSAANPICFILDYRKEMFRAIAKLKVLDGLRSNIDSFSLYKDEDLRGGVDANQIDKMDFNFSKRIILL